MLTLIKRKLENQYQTKQVSGKKNITCHKEGYVTIISESVHQEEGYKNPKCACT